MAAAVWDLQRCALCCSYGSLASTPGCSRFELSGVAGQSLRSAFPVGGLPKLTLRKCRGGKRLGTRAVTRFVLLSRIMHIWDAGMVSAA